MKFVVLLLLSACAVGQVTPYGVRGFAIGQAKLEQCATPPPPEVPTCSSISGGALSGQAKEALRSVLGLLRLLLPALLVAPEPVEAPAVPAGTATVSER